ncbi:MAG TPA: potassium-transporting ATPase subunit KdpA [Chthoniobacterales bacterium]|nr:potassium-transporting ATPase subunit KdpA [Chthoniobacterales bacterium]
MNKAGILQAGLFLVVVFLCLRPLGVYLERVFARDRTFLDPLLLPAERLAHRLVGINPKSEMNWKRYALAFTLFGVVNIAIVYFLFRCQVWLPWFFPSVMTTPMTSDLAANTAVSFATTTTWQAYAGETTMSYFSQLVLAGQNFAAGAAGLAVGIAFIRGYARERTDRLGNFWSDLIRALLWVLLPMSILGSLLLVALGVPLNFHPYTVAQTVEGGTQIIAQGPVAALEFIKNLGTNGGGFFNVNAAHPFENPNGLTNFLELFAIVVIPAAFTHTFGRMVGRRRDGWVIFWTMTALFIAGLIVCNFAELATTGRDLVGGNMEGKEVRFGVNGSALAAVVTSNGATGSYNSMHDSFQPLGVLVPLVNMLLGEIIFGGLGTGLISMIFVALIALFVGGLMIGRTPEHLGKRIGVSEMKIIALYSLVCPAVVLALTSMAVVTRPGLAGLTTNSGAHGFTEILFAYASAFANNGQNMAGLSANNIFYNLTTTVAMLAGRFLLSILALALAGRFAAMGHRKSSVGTMPSDGLPFGVLLAATTVLLGALNFLPALALGPLVEHFSIHAWIL